MVEDVVLGVLIAALGIIGFLAIALYQYGLGNDFVEELKKWMTS